jgi:hypothetical protein
MEFYKSRMLLAIHMVKSITFISENFKEFLKLATEGVGEMMVVIQS